MLSCKLKVFICSLFPCSCIVMQVKGVYNQAHQCVDHMHVCMPFFIPDANSMLDSTANVLCYLHISSKSFLYIE